MTSQEYDQDIKENQDLIKELNLTHPCKNVCSGYRQAVEEATPEMLIKNRYVDQLIKACRYYLKNSNETRTASTEIAYQALMPFEVDK